MALKHTASICTALHCTPSGRRRRASLSSRPRAQLSRSKRASAAVNRGVWSEWGFPLYKGGAWERLGPDVAVAEEGLTMNRPAWLRCTAPSPSVLQCGTVSLGSRLQPRK
ncbi:hypothetical protein AAFF_G00169000 [Aldrovandia affinis]|uniref:Uncharacterized protein n=1 Tax=Aldrovandia affinis TaxID=143900 RepID=A0AAD7RLW4_9TELE|nr:hypothetical protein AAFF_G00169000 [Aldrovandia affinis]